MILTDSATSHLMPGPVLPKDADRFAAWLADLTWAKLFQRDEISITKASARISSPRLFEKNSASIRLPIRCGESGSKAITASPDSFRMDSTAQPSI